ncbi:sperm associated antigen 8 isoform X2 [Clupea harengus]|uniref:Sperm associated antigen 8 isoform X2 n=1 Tax=Clupea harengus TaxID=7950 RepID=A0A6P8G9J0_CLUHA|nr:sperm associated antigen 8 isoform X2 [Clupea harengus]
MFSLAAKLGAQLEEDASMLKRATALLDNSMPRTRIPKNGHRGILALDMTAKVQGISTIQSSYTPPKGPGVRQKGLRGELLEKHLYKKISEEVQTELNPGPLATEFCSTTQADFSVEGFRCVTPTPSQEYDYRTDQAITFWSENCHRAPGVTAVRNKDTPFRKNASFSTPISEQLDSPML